MSAEAGGAGGHGDGEHLHRRTDPAHSNTVFELQPDGDGTQVTWRMIGPHTAVTRLMGVFLSMDRMVGPDFEKGLARLRAAAEAADG